MTFAVISQVIYHEGEITRYIVPIFTGIIDPEKEEYLKAFANDLSETLNFTDIKFDLEKNNAISHENSFEYFHELSESDSKKSDEKKKKEPKIMVDSGC